MSNKHFINKKKGNTTWSVIIFIPCIILLLFGCAVKDKGADLEAVRNITVSENEETLAKVVNEDGKDYEQIYNMLNGDKLQENLFSPWPDEISESSEGIWNSDIDAEMVKIEYEGTFPKELVKELGNILMKNSMQGKQSMAENSDYFNYRNSCLFPKDNFYAI